MATQFMYSQAHSPSFGGGYNYSNINGHQNGYAQFAPNGRSFAFRKRFERVDWRKIASVDADYISRTLDFNALQENIMNITFCNIESELDLRMVDPNFVKLFKLAQLCIEYLLHSQEYLTGVISSTEEKLKKVQEEQNELNETMEKQKKELTDTKKESHKRKKLLMAQQQLIHAGSGSYNKCPYCPKAFLNSSFLQSHIARRHTDLSSKAASVAVGVQDQGSMSPDIHSQIEQLKERLRATESELTEERKRKMQIQEETKQAVKLQQVEPQQLKEDEREMYVKEIHDVNEKYQQLEKAMTEMSYRSRTGRSNLGEIQDDDVDNELLRQQREDMAMLKEEMEQKMKTVDEKSRQLQKQEKRWQRKIDELKKQHADDLSKLSNVLEKSLTLNKKGVKSEQDKEEIKQILRHVSEVNEMTEVTEFENEVDRESQEKEILLRSGEEEEIRRERVAEAVKSPVRSMMMPSSDEEEETTELESALATGRTAGSGTLTQSLYSTNRSGELTLRTTQFLEELRKNPTLKLMRDELDSLVKDHLNKIGIPPETRGIADDVLNNKLGLLKTRRQSTTQKYAIFPDFRKQCNAYAEQQARERLKEMRRSPPPSQGASRTTSPIRPASITGTPQHVSSSGPYTRKPQQLQVQQGVKAPARPVQVQSPKPQPVPRAASPQRTLQSTGGTTGTATSVDYTSTQWDSDDDDEDDSEEDEPAFQHVRRIQSGPQRNISPSPKPRTAPSPRQPAVAPRTQAPQIRTVMSKPLNDDDDEDDDWDDSELDISPTKPRQKSSTLPVTSSTPVRVQPRGTNVAQLSKTIEMQLAGRKADSKPVGGVDLAANKKTDILDDVFDSDEDDWDVSSIEDDKPAKTAPKKGPMPVRASHASDISSNTYGTSVWGSSSKAASSVPCATTPSPAGPRGSFVSVTDVSSDEDLDLDNI